MSWYKKKHDPDCLRSDRNYVSVPCICEVLARVKSEAYGHKLRHELKPGTACNCVSVYAGKESNGANV